MSQYMLEYWTKLYGGNRPGVRYAPRCIEVSNRGLRYALRTSNRQPKSCFEIYKSQFEVSASSKPQN